MKPKGYCPGLPTTLSFRTGKHLSVDRPGWLVTLRENGFPNTSSHIPTEGILGQEELCIVRLKH